MIPQVRTWRVVFKHNNERLASLEVQAPTKYLAWLAVAFDHPQFLQFKVRSTKITIAPIH